MAAYFFVIAFDNKSATTILIVLEFVFALLLILEKAHRASTRGCIKELGTVAKTSSFLLLAALVVLLVVELILLQGDKEPSSAILGLSRLCRALVLVTRVLFALVILLGDGRCSALASRWRAGFLLQLPG